jgi:hypothetical protein
LPQGLIVSVLELFAESITGLLLISVSKAGATVVCADAIIEISPNKARSAVLEFLHAGHHILGGFFELLISIACEGFDRIAKFSFDWG